MALANVALTDTFDIWRTRTNQLIGVYDETNLLSRASFNATNSFVSSTANLTANLITSNATIMATIYNNANTVVASNAGNILFSNAQFVTAVYDNANTVIPAAVLSNTTVMNNFYNNANTVISSNAANIIYSNTIILTNFYNNANSLVDGYLANNNVTSVLLSVNTINAIAIAAFDTANSGVSAAPAFDKANAANITASAAFDKANTAGGGYYKGNNGDKGLEANKNDIFRVNNNYINSNIYFSSGENGSATGPLTVNTGFILQVNTDARVVIL